METTDNPEFKPFTNDFTEDEALKRRARAIAASKNLFRTDISKLDDAQVSGLYQATARALFQIEDPDGKVAFGKRAGDARTNVGLLRDFCKGNYKLIQDDEYETWRAMDEEQRFRHALENEGAENKAKSYFQRRGLSISDLAGAGMPGAQFGNVFQNAAAPGRDEVLRKQNYENLTPEEQAVYRKDVIEDYEKKLSKRQVLATYLAMTDGLSDRASTLLAKAYNTGTVDVEAMEALPQKERDQAYTALSIMRGDQKKGHILGIPTDFTDDTAANRLQLCLYGFQQGVLGLIPDTYELGKDITKAAYAKFCLDDAERKRYIDRWDAQVRMEQALKQGLPEADSWWGAGFQGAAESFALMVPYLGIGKGGKMMRAATAVGEDASWWKKAVVSLNPLRAGSRHRARAKLVEGVKAVEEADYADTFARLSQWKTVGGGDLTVGNQLLARQLANIENYTKELRELKKLSGADLRKWGLGAAAWSAGEATSFGSFAKEYVETCDAAGISRYDSVPMAAVVGLVNAQIENLYVPGLESTLSAWEVKSLMFGSLLQTVKSDGAKGFRKWLANRIEKGVVEGVKVTATEGMVEEPLQQIVTEHGKAIAKTAGKLRENGQGDLADQLSAYWDATKDTLANDFQTFVDTAVDTLPSSVVFGLTTIGNQTRRQRLHNIMTRHENRAKYAREVELAKSEGREIPAPPVMLSKAENGSLRFNPNGVDYDAGIADMIGRAAATQKAVTDYWAGDGQEREGEDVRLANALAAARKAWDAGEGDVYRQIADAAQVDMRTAEVIAEYFIAEDETKLYSPQLRAFADYSLSAADMSEKTLERILPGYVKGSYKADEKNGVYSGQVKLEDGSVKTIAYKVGDISEELMKAAEDQIKDDSELGDSHDERIRSGAERGGKFWAQMSEQERYAYALRGVNALAVGSGVIEMTDADGNVSRISADDVIYLSNGRFGDVGYGPMATLGTARHETWHAIWRFTKSTFTEDERRKLADRLGVDVSDPKWERKLDEAMAYQFELYASGAYVPHVATGAIDRLMQSTAAKWIGELSKFGLADEVKNAKTGKAFELADFYDAVMRGEIGTGRLGIAQVATETPQPGAAEPQKKTRKELPVGVSKEELAEAERAAAEAAAGTAPETPENGKPVSDNANPESVNAAKTDYTLDRPANASVPDARFYRISAGDGVDLVGELVVSDARDLKTSYKGNLSDPSLQNRAETNEGRSLVEKIAGSPDPLQVGTVQPRANNGFVWTTPSLDTFIGNTRESGISAAYEKGNAAAVKAYMLAEAAKRGIEVPEGIEQPIVHFVLWRIESKDGKASIQDVVRMTNQSVNRGMNVYEQAKNDADVLAGAGLIPHIALRPDGRIDTAKSAEAIGRFIQETGAQGMVDENTDSLTEDGQARLQNAVLAALLGNENADTVAKMMREADRLDIENEKRALMKTAAELMRIAAAKPQYDLRQPLAEALDYYLNWRDVDELRREEAGKNRRDWYERTKDGERKRGLTWSMHMGQGDMFRTPSPEARLLGDLLAASRDLRSFDAEDRETDAGKKRAQDLVTTFIGDYIRNADAVNTETVDLLGTPPPSRIELLETHRGTDASRRFSTVVSPTLREDVEAALLKRDEAHPDAKQKGRHDEIVFSDNIPVFEFLGLPNLRVVTEVSKIRKFAIKHHLSVDQIVDIPNGYDNPVAIMSDDDGYVLLTDRQVTTDDGEQKPMRLFLRPTKWRSGEVVLLATAMAENGRDEQEYYEPRIKAGLMFADKNRIAGLNLGEETESILRIQASGESVKTEEDFSSWRSTQESIAQSAANDNDVSFSTIASGLSGESRLRRMDGSTLTDTPSFKAWFGDSKVVDADGRPLKVYRGSPYDPLKQPAGKGVIKPEAYFTADPEYARRYGKVNAYYLRMRKPFDIRNAEDAARLREFYPQGYQFAVGRNGALDWGEMANFDLDELREKYPEYDGIILDEGGDPQIDGSVKDRGVSYVPFDGGAQVKSATDNIGTFDPANRDVRFSTVSTDTPAFKSWFGKSKMVDADGKPRIFWHGTNWNILKEKKGKAVFDDAYRGTGSGDMGFFGRGHYFAYTEGEASYYGRNVIPVFLKIENPFDFQKELDTLWGKSTALGFAGRLAPVVNLAEKFPEIAKEYTATYRGEETGIGEYELKEVSLADIAKEAERVHREVKFEVRKIENSNEVIVRAEPRKVKEGAAEWTEYRYEERFFNENDANDELLRVYDYLEKILFPNLDLPNITDVMQTKEFTAAIKAKGHDGIIQSESGDEAVVFDSRQVKSATHNRGTFDPANPDIRYSTVGRFGAANLGIEGSLEASRMEEAGVDRVDIWRQTGWWRGNDGKWRVEVDPPYLADRSKFEFLKGGELVYLGDLFPDSPVIRAYGLEWTPVIIDFDGERQVLNGATAAYGFQINGKEGIVLSPSLVRNADTKPSAAQLHMLENFSPDYAAFSKEFWRIFNEYDKLGEEKADEQERKAREEFGATDAAKIYEDIRSENGERFIPNERFLSVMTHEIQHIIQDREGFAKGGNPGLYSKGTSTAEIDDRIAGLNAELDKVIAAGEDRDAFDRLRKEIKEAEDEKMKLQKDARDKAILRYQLLAGEVEARNVEKRLKMPIEKRLATPPWETDDVKADDQIVRFSTVATPWRPDFPDAIAHTTRAYINGHYAEIFNRAKAGDVEAAADLVEKVCKIDKIRQLGKDHPNARLVAPVVAFEKSGHNQIPRAFAEYVAEALGIDVADGIVQTVRAGHTGADASHRLFTSPEFDGEVVRGAEYIIVDDHITQGGTINALRDHIERNGGKVVAVSALTLSQGSSKLSPRKDTLDELYAKWPDIDNFLRIGGIAESAGALTQSQAKYILKFSPDTFRDRAVAQGIPRGGRVLQETLGASPSAEVGDSTPAAPRRSFSTVGSAYPGLNRLSDEQLIAVALASKTVFGKAGKKQSQHFTINEVQRHIKALHPDWDGPKVSLESTRIYQLVRPIKAKLQEDIQRGVSQSNILQHLPERLKEEFGSEMTQQARTGARIGTAHQRAVTLLEERKVKVVEDAVRVQSGVASQILENQYGVDLSRTLMNLADNPALKKDGQGNYLPPASAGTAPDEAAGASAESTVDEKDVDEKVKKAVTEIVGKTQEELDRSEANRRSLSDQRGRDAEREAELAGEASEGAGLDPEDGDIVEIATRKAGVDLQNPRHLALFVTELARRHWVKEHGLAEDAEAFNDAVALQFLRKTAQDVYGKLVRDITYSQSRDSATAAINGFEHVPTLRGLISEMTFAGQLINARKIRETAQGMCEKLDTFLREKFGATGRFKPDNEELRRKVSTEMELRARYARHAIWLTPNAAGKEADLLQKEIDAAATDFDREDHDAEQSRVMIENIRKINILREFGGLCYKPLAQIQSALEYWDNAQQGEADQIGRENLEREIRTKKAAEVLAKAFRNPKTKYAKDGKALASAIDNYITGHMGFTHLLRDMMRYASKEDAAAAETILQYLELEIQKGGTRVMTQKRRHADALAKAVQRIYGRNFSKVLAEFCKEDERFAEFMGETDGKKDMPTKGRAMQLMVSLLQVGRQVEVIDETDPERKKTKLEWQGGYHDNIVKHHREAQAAKIAALLSPQDLQLVKWLGNWYDTNRQELSAVCQDLFGIGVYAETSNYMPVKMRLDAQGLEKGEAVGWTIFPKALMPRVRNERDFDTRADILQMFMARMEEGEQWKAHAKLGLEMRGIFGRSELQASVIASHGTKANALMLGFVTDILAGQGARQRAASGDAVENYTDWIRGWAALGALGGNVGVTFKQTTSIPAFGFEVGLVKTGRYMLSAFTPDGMAAMRKIWDSDERKNRWNVGNSEAVANALAGNDVGTLKRLMRASMVTNKVGDSVPALVCGQGIYRDCIEQGMDEEDAMAKTWMLIERTQQSGRVENQAGFQRRTKFGRALYQFLTTQQQYLSYEARAIRSVVAKPGDIGRWGKLGDTLVLNHFLLSSAYFWMGQLYKRLLGQEPDEDGELADWMVSCLLGPYGALYGLGITTTEAINTWIKGRKFGTQGQLPSLSWASNFIVHDPARLVGACFSDEKTFDDVLDAAAKWASDSNAIFRDLRKVYRWRIKEELQ